MRCKGSTFSLSRMVNSSINRTREVELENIPGVSRQWCEAGSPEVIFVLGRAAVYFLVDVSFQPGS